CGCWGRASPEQEIELSETNVGNDTKDTKDTKVNTRRPRSPKRTCRIEKTRSRLAFSPAAFVKPVFFVSLVSIVVIIRITQTAAHRSGPARPPCGPDRSRKTRQSARQS